jgi:hypothetical protein
MRIYGASQEHVLKAPVRNSVSRAFLIAVLTYISGICGAKFSKKKKLFQKTADVS